MKDTVARQQHKVTHQKQQLQQGRGEVEGRRSPLKKAEHEDDYGYAEQQRRNNENLRLSQKHSSPDTLTMSLLNKEKENSGEKGQPGHTRNGSRKLLKQEGKIVLIKLVN